MRARRLQMSVGGQEIIGYFNDTSHYDFFGFQFVANIAINFLHT